MMTNEKELNTPESIDENLKSSIISDFEDSDSEDTLGDSWDPESTAATTSSHSSAPTKFAYDYNNCSEEADDDENESWKVTIRRYAKILLPHFALSFLCGLYIFLGAAYFYYHESAFETKSKTQKLTKFFKFREVFYHKISTLISSNSSEENIRETQKELFVNFIAQVFHLKNNQYISNEDLHNEIIEDKETVWTFSNSIFFSTIILSTIGYGSTTFAPATFYGKIGCIIFGIIGIPIFIVTISDIGKFLSENLIWFYPKYEYLKEKIIVILINKLRKPVNWIFAKNGTELISKRYERRKDAWDEDKFKIPFSAVFFILMTLFAFIGFLLSIFKGWSFFDSFFVSFTTVTTIRFGNEIPSKNDSVFLIIVCIIFGQAYVRMFNDLCGVQFIQKIHYFGRNYKKIFISLKSIKKEEKQETTIYKSYRRNAMTNYNYTNRKY